MFTATPRRPRLLRPLPPLLLLFFLFLVLVLVLPASCSHPVAGTIGLIGPSVSRSAGAATLTDPGGATREVEASAQRSDLEFRVAAGGPWVVGMGMIGGGGAEVHTRDTGGTHTLRGASVDDFEMRWGVGAGASLPFAQIRPGNAVLFGEVGQGYESALQSYLRFGLLITTPAYLSFAIGYERSAYSVNDDFGVMAPGTGETGASTGDITVHGIFLSIGVGRWQGGIR